MVAGGYAIHPLKEEAHGKCCYCEADTATVAHGDVEHFRPKSRYWWLALCIDNYTYSCQICNQSYKGDEFPITGAKLLEPALPKKVPISAAARAKLAAKICPDPATVKDAELRTVWFKEDVVEHGQPACSPTRSTTATADGVRHSQDGIAGRLRCSGRVLDSAGSRHPLRRICWRVTSRQQRRTRRGAATSPTSPLMRAGCT